MENASKALLMAGGVLIAIIILALLVKSSETVSSFQKMQLSEEEQSRLIAFNEQYTKYIGQYVYGTEVLTLKNRYENDHQVMVILENGDDLITGGGQDIQYYYCKSVNFDDQTGRVNSITFKRVNPLSDG